MLLNKKKYFVQFFGIENLLFNVSKHKLVPKHRKLSEEEINSVSVKYGMPKNSMRTKLALIRREDPIAKYIGLKPNDICEITYPSLATCEYVKYRVCTN